MVLSMACFIVNDTLVKFVSQSLPAGQLIFLRGLMATVLVLAFMRATGAPVRPRVLAVGGVAVRSVLDALMQAARERGFVAGDRVRLVNERAALTLALVPSPDMPRGLVRVDGMPRGVDVPEGHGVNALTSGAVSDLGDGSVAYSARVDLVRA